MKLFGNMFTGYIKGNKADKEHVLCDMFLTKKDLKDVHACVYFLYKND